MKLDLTKKVISPTGSDTGTTYAKILAQTLEEAGLDPEGKPYSAAKAVKFYSIAQRLKSNQPIDIDHSDLKELESFLDSAPLVGYVKATISITIDETRRNETANKDN